MGTVIVNIALAAAGIALVIACIAVPNLIVLWAALYVALWAVTFWIRRKR